MMEMTKKLRPQFCFQMRENFLVSKLILIQVTFLNKAFGKDALQLYAEMLDEEETALLF